MNLEARGIVVTRKDGRGGERRILDGATFTLRERTVASLEGASGSGKTTLLRVMASLVEPDGGMVLLGGVDAKTLAPSVFRRRVAYVLQQPPMLEGSVADNIACGPRLRGERVDVAAVAALLERVGLDPSIGARAARELSGGEKQRVAFARALANEPEIMLLDEPTAALDSAAAALIVELVRGLVANGLSALVVTHIEEHARALGGERFECKGGAVVPKRRES